MTHKDGQTLQLGIDVGGTKAVIVAARASGEILAETRIEQWASGDWERDLETLAEQGLQILAEAGASSADVSTLGLSVPGPLDVRAGRVIEAPNLPGWVDVPIVARLRQVFDVPILLENDANAAALAEWRFGAGQGARNLIYLTMSTGIGAGLILDGRLYRGATYQAGEVGHVPVVPGGRKCSCGLRGCLEAYTGGAAIAEMIREDLEAGVETSIRSLADGDPARVSAALWVEALRAGDAYAEQLRERFLDHLAQGIALLLPIFDPERVVLGTILQRNPDLFLQATIERVRALTWPSLHHVELVPARLGDRLPAYAALCAASLDPAELGP
jgi:glucokinase